MKNVIGKFLPGGQVFTQIVGMNSLHGFDRQVLDRRIVIIDRYGQRTQRFFVAELSQSSNGGCPT